jgi:hypothetical protein
MGCGEVETMRDYLVTFANGRRMRVAAADAAQARRRAYAVEHGSAVANVEVARAA